VAEDETWCAGGVVVKVRSVVGAVAAGMRVVGRARAAAVRLPRSIFGYFNLY